MGVQVACCGQAQFRVKNRAVCPGPLHQIRRQRCTAAADVTPAPHLQVAGFDDPSWAQDVPGAFVDDQNIAVGGVDPAAEIDR